jgi:hypothetical protein
MTTNQMLLRNSRIDVGPTASAFSAAADSTEALAQRERGHGPMPSRVTLSLVIPCYNEEKTLEACIDKVLAIADDTLDLELIIVDDCSKDRSLEVAQSLKSRIPNLVVLHHEKNQGKGAALRTGFTHATGHFVAVQDADLEYDPMDLKRLLIPLRNGEADVVLGSRFLSLGYHRVLYFWHSLGNRFLTLLSNMLTDLNLTDMETCYKVFRRDVIQSIDIEENRFGFEPEVVAKIAQRRLVQRSHVCRGQEDRRQRRVPRVVLHPQVQPAQGPVDRAVLLLHVYRRRLGHPQSPDLPGAVSEPRRVGRGSGRVLRRRRPQLLPVDQGVVPASGEMEVMGGDCDLSRRRRRRQPG